MKKAAARTTTTEKSVEQYLAALNAKRQFYGAALNMSWRLAITVIVPIIIGVKLDERFGTSPSLVLSGFFIAVFGAAVAVWDTVKDVNSMQTKRGKRVR